jgi:DNA-binding transcriptional ArsR family regulator
MKRKVPLSKCAQYLAALAAPERLEVIRLLRGGPRNVSEIAEELAIPVVNLSHHLAVLRHAGVLRSRKQGRFVEYSLAPGLLQAGGPDTDYLDFGCCRLEMPRAPVKA